MSDGQILLSSTNGIMWELFKSIIQETSKEPSEGSHDEIKRLAESGIEFLKEESL